MSSSAFGKMVDVSIVKVLQQTIRDKGLDTLKHTLENMRQETSKKGTGRNYIFKLTPDSLDQFASQFSRDIDIRYTKQFREKAGKSSDKYLEEVLLDAAHDLVDEMFGEKSMDMFKAFAIYILNKNNESNKNNKIIRSYTSANELNIRNISHRRALNLFKDFLREYLHASASSSTLLITEKDRQRVIDFIVSTVQMGHLSGVFNIKLIEAFNLIGTDINTASTYRDINISTATEVGGMKPEDLTRLNQTFTHIMKTLSDADYISNSFLDNIKVSTNAVKVNLDKKKNGDYTAIVTAQLGSINMYFGSLLMEMGDKLNTLLEAANRDINLKDPTSDTVAVAREFINSIKPVLQAIKKTGNKLIRSSDIDNEIRQRIAEILTDANTVDKLLKTPGSDPLLTAIGKAYLAELKKEKYTGQKTEIPKKVHSLTGIKSQVKKSNAKIKLLKKDNKSQSKIKLSLSGRINQPSSGLDLLTLQNLINSMLTQQIKENMGTGNRRDILNLRTGRFAESVKVERMSESRQGMITAFYTYMKNPYATFSEGGRQEFPRTRDPKLLISRSIREIAAQQVANKLRAVSL